MNFEFRGQINLYGDSTFYFFTRSYLFDENTVVIKFSKETFSNKIVASICTWLKDENDKLVFKTIVKQQLIEKDNKSINNPSKRDDFQECTNLKFIIQDSNDERISIRVVINDSTYVNELSSDCFLPNLYNSYTIMFGSYGGSVIFKSLNYKISKKTSFEYDDIFTNERKNCECCNIY